MFQLLKPARRYSTYKFIRENRPAGYQQLNYKTITFVMLSIVKWCELQKKNGRYNSSLHSMKKIIKTPNVT